MRARRTSANSLGESHDMRAACSARALATSGRPMPMLFTNTWPVQSSKAVPSERTIVMPSHRAYVLSGDAERSSGIP